MLQNLHVSYGHCTPLQTDFSFTFPLQINSNNNNSLHVKNISSSSSSRMKNLAYCVYDKSKLLLINWLSLKQILCLTALFFLFLHSYLFVYGPRFYFDLSRLDWRIISVFFEWTLFQLEPLKNQNKLIKKPWTLILFVFCNFLSICFRIIFFSGDKRQINYLYRLYYILMILFLIFFGVNQIEVVVFARGK